MTATETVKVPKGINNNLSLRMNKKVSDNFDCKYIRAIFQMQDLLEIL